MSIGNSETVLNNGITLWLNAYMNSTQRISMDEMNEMRISALKTTILNCEARIAELDEYVKFKNIKKDHLRKGTWDNRREIGSVIVVVTLKRVRSNLMRTALRPVYKLTGYLNEYVTFFKARQRVLDDKLAWQTRLKAAEQKLSECK